ncbi:MAG: XdhC family protein [Armatimonadota bacterium]|nr:XdhC family protein [Armatimonadota bacterium]MDR5676205.1 XdhC family protein [Armatimonadota bacterium]MDR5689158.1 XdhC family protein [Armatimonadota bacterium]MDR7388872.1 XdhC family protein [Armatimonadota bacterium]MDR7396111.1 XdhC family protein [Armatimonadota bacterium]
MRELLDILAGLRDARTRDEEAALATVVGVRGSTYRREGARLLILASGRTVGSVSGGCLEGDIQVVAEEVLRDGRARLLHYDLTADDEAVWGLGLGCNGVIDVLLEKVGVVQPSPESYLARAVEQEVPLAVVSVVGPEAADLLGRRVVVEESRRVTGSLGRPDLDAAALELGQQALSSERPCRAAADAYELFAEPILPPPRLVVCGAGHDAIPVVHFAAELGLRPVVVDRREKFLTRERFPQAHGFLHTEFPLAAQAVRPDGRTFVVIMTHNYLHDRDLLRSFLTYHSFPAYVGVLGPRQRTQKILQELAESGVVPSAEQRQRLFTPVGLDIGAEGPEQIALAILAEILAARNGRSGGFLRDRPARIHEAVPASG